MQGHFKSFVGILIVLSVSLLAGPVFGQATVTVDIETDEFDVVADDECSLREAIETFNRKGAFGGCSVVGAFNNDESDTIDFEDEAGTPDTYILDIDGFGENSNSIGDLDLTVSATIQGHGVDETIITTAWEDFDKDRVLHIYCDTDLNSQNANYEDCDPSIEVQIFGLTIKGGDVSGEDGFSDLADGGGILFEDLDDSNPGSTNPVPGVSTLELGDEELGGVILTENFALNGGGLAFKGLDLDIDNCQIFDNRAGDRRDSSIADMPALGGGVFAKGYAGDFQDDDDTDGSNVFITDSSITDNVAAGSSDAPLAAGAGLALAVIDETGFDGVTISRNRTEAAIITFGAGLFAILIDDDQVATELDLLDVFITENDGSDDVLSFGGGMAVGADGATMDAIEITVAHNLSASGGGVALFNDDGFFFLLIGVFDSALGNFSDVVPEVATYNFSECSIFNNEANGDPVLSELLEQLGAGSGFENLNVFGVGGGLLNLTGDVDIRNCTVSNNRATFDGGGLFNGGIFGSTIDGDSKPAFMDITNVTITLNQTHGSGGGIRNDSDIGTDPNVPDLDDVLSEVNIRNTILAGNLRFGGAQGDECFTDEALEIISGGFNVLGEPPTILTDCNMDDVASDQLIDPADLFDDVLLPFVDSPGFFEEAGKQHHPLRGLVANIAIDEADDTICTGAEDLDEDQIDENRVDIDGAVVGQDCATDTQCCDVGAIEYVGVCGDGNIDEVLGEECDDGNLDSGDGCDEECILEVCGNGKVQEDEDCDDGNTNNNDSCLDTCEEAECGDGEIWNEDGGTEECDDFGFETATCNDDCTTPACGDEIVNEAFGEQCDPVGGIPSADCDDDCSLPFCGDENLNTMTIPAEECDPPGGLPTSLCNFDCTENFCGDSIQNMLANEECDDGNLEPGDGCDEDCELEFCGNDKQQAGEECDGTDVPPGGVCDDNCFLIECENGILQDGEDCDDGGVTGPFDFCDENCEFVTFCGDGVTNGGEDCDEGLPPDNQTDECNFDCTTSDCPDGKPNPADGEECDDGNNEDNDGCSNSCTINVGDLCGNGELNPPDEECDLSVPGTLPSECDFDCSFPDCDDSILNLESGEECEDGNTEDGDGCSAVCLLEIPEFCGNGRLDDGEFCDLTVPETDPAECDIDCTAPVCGDNLLNQAAGEQCEDGNMDDNDGCSSDCQIEEATEPADEETTFGICGGCDGSGSKCGTSLTQCLPCETAQGYPGLWYFAFLFILYGKILLSRRRREE